MSLMAVEQNQWINYLYAISEKNEIRILKELILLPITAMAFEYKMLLPNVPTTTQEDFRCCCIGHW
jgi:hypothetical protein